MPSLGHGCCWAPGWRPACRALSLAPKLSVGWFLSQEAFRSMGFPFTCLIPLARQAVLSPHLLAGEQNAPVRSPCDLDCG